MPAQIRPTRLEVSDRFPMLGFSIRTEGPPQRAEVALASEPGLFGAEGKTQRTAANFYSTRAAGPLQVPRGEAVFIVPPEVLARFIGKEKLYFGLATVGEAEGGAMQVAVKPTEASPYVSLKGLTGRSMKRVRVLPSRQQRAAGYSNGGQSALEWAGDVARPGMEPVRPNGAAKANGKASGATPATHKHTSYDDGFGPMPPPPAPPPATGGLPPAPAQALGATPVTVTGQQHPVQAPPVRRLSDLQRSLIVTGLGALAGPLAPLLLVLPAAARAANVSIGVGPTVGAGLGAGGTLGAGLIFGPDGGLGVYGSAEVDIGFITSISATVQITVVRGAIENFNGWSMALAISGGEGIVGGASALFDANANFQGVSVSAGIGVGFSPVDFYVAAQRGVATQLGMAAALGQLPARVQPPRRAHRPASLASHALDTDPRAQDALKLNIIKVAAASDIARYFWLPNRGVAPAGYIKGMALVYARVYGKLKAGDAAALEMAKAKTADPGRDALTWCDDIFASAGMSNDTAGVDTLRHLFVLLIGLGMRESSGKYCEGVYRPDKNFAAETAEAGLFQTSFNTRTASPLLPALFAQYSANPSGFLDIFEEGIRCSASDLENFGSGDGREFQRLSKECPAFAAEYAAVALRNRRGNWAPINKKVVEIRPECDAMLRQVEACVDASSLSEALSSRAQWSSVPAPRIDYRAEASPGKIWSRAQEIITPFYDQNDPSSALSCQNNAFSLAREEWFMGVPNTRIFPHSAICQLNTVDAAGKGWSGTGFYIGPNRILTAAHMLYGGASVTIIPGKNGGAEPFGRCTLNASSWRVSNRYPSEGSNFDLAVIDNVPIAAPGGQWFTFLNATPSDRLPIVVCGYSAQSDAVPGLTDAIDGDMQHLHGGYVKEQSNMEVMEYPILTLHGASGAPVYTIRGDGAQLRALVCGVHVSGEPAAQGLNRGCFITPNKIDWIEGRTAALSLGNGAQQSFTINWDEVQSIAQPTDKSCWAAAAAMVIGWSDQVKLTPETIREICNRSTRNWENYGDEYQDEYKSFAYEAFAKEMWLFAEPAHSYTLDGFRELLTSYGPLWVSKFSHAIVITGLYSDGASTYVRVTDPWDHIVGSPGSLGQYLPPLATGSRYIMKWEDFVAEYGINLKIVHSHRVKGRTANTGGSTPVGYAQSAGQSAALSNESFTINWDEVESIAQPTNMSCWATAAAMVVGWRDRVSLSPESVAAIGGRSIKTGLNPAEMQDFAREMGLSFEYPASYSVDGFRRLLANNGPLFVGAAVPGLHAIVVTGLYSDGTDTYVRITDPWDRTVGSPGSPGQYLSSHATGSRYIMKWQDFVAEYERAATDFSRVNLQILHSGGTAGRTANTGGSIPSGYAQGMSANARSMAGYAASPARNGIFSQGQAGAFANPGPEPATSRRMPLQHHLTGAQHGVRWDLVQYDGLKSPARANPAGGRAVADGQQIDLGDWPFLPAADPKAVSDERTRAPVRIDWRYRGGAVGDVRVTPGPFQAYDGWSVALAATVADGPDTPDIAALRVTVRTVFSKPAEANHVAVTSVTLFGDGRLPVREDAWEQPVVKVAA